MEPAFEDWLISVSFWIGISKCSFTFIFLFLKQKGLHNRSCLLLGLLAIFVLHLLHSLHKNPYVTNIHFKDILKLRIVAKNLNPLVLLNCRYNSVLTRLRLLQFQVVINIFFRGGKKNKNFNCTLKPAGDKRRYEEEASRPEPRRSRYLFRHPYSRLATAYLVVFFNFLIFAEDPVSHSYRECVIDVIGDLYTFVFIR